jgi:hypothetical protein
MTMSVHPLKCGAGFYALDVESGSALSLYVPMPSPKKGISPIAIIPKDATGNCDILLCFSSTL